MSNGSERMPEHSAAEELRAAARLMRERAEAAPAGPWYVYETTTHRCVGTNGVVRDRRNYKRKRQVGYATEATPEFANHAASWHPAVALAVADWLEAEAASMQSMANFTSIAASIEHEVNIRGAALTVRKDERGGVSLTADTSAPALAVARAYLGTQEAPDA